MEANENVGMKPSANRVADDIVKWAAMEAKDRKILGDDLVSKPNYAMDKYKYFKNLQKKYAGTNNPDERRYLNALKDELPKLKKAALPLKSDRFFYNAMEYSYEAVMFFVSAAKQIAKVVAAYQDRKREQQITSKINDPRTREIKETYDRAVRPVLDNNKKEIAGPDRHLRGNNVEPERGKDEKVRYEFANEFPLLQKKSTAKTESIAFDDEPLIPKKHQNTGKGLSI